MSIFRIHAIWLPRIMLAVLGVFTIDVALASTCCPLTVSSSGTAFGDAMTIVDEAAPAMLNMQSGGDNCPSEQGNSEHPDHNACCLACVALLPGSQLAELTAVPHAFSRSLIGSAAPALPDHPFRPPIIHLL